MDLKTTMGNLSGNTSEDLKMLYNYVFQLTEELRYLINNLDVTNFNDLGLARYENGRLQVYSEVVEVRAKKVESVVEALGNDLGEFENWTEGEIESVRSSFSQTAGQIEAKVQALDTDVGELSSKLTLTSNSVSAIVSNVGSGNQVTVASIIAAINSEAGNSSSFIQLKAEAVDISGMVTFNDLSSDAKDEYGNPVTVINGSNISAGEISAINFIASGNLDGGISNSFVISDGNWPEYWIGNIGYQWVDEDGVYGDKLWIRTKRYKLGDTRYYPAIKIESAGGVSIEAGADRGVYIYDGTAEWMFKSGVLTRTIDGESTVVIQ